MNLDTHCGAGTEQLNGATYRDRRLGLRSTGEGRGGPVGRGVPLGRALGHSTARGTAAAAGAHPHKAGGMGTTRCGHSPSGAAMDGADGSGSRTTPSLAPLGPGETRGGCGRGRWRGVLDRTGWRGQSLAGGAGPSVAPLSPGRRGAPASPRSAHLQHTGGVCRALLQLLPGFVVVVVVVCVG